MLFSVPLAENRSDRWRSSTEDAKGFLFETRETMRCCIETGFQLYYVFKLILRDFISTLPAGWASYV